jgi:TRAP-type C4-dicarboxylate transport system permease small subunit
MRNLLDRFYRGLLYLAALSMVATLVTILLGVAGRQFNFNLPGLDAYAGYSIAAALFLALPATLRNGDHIRVTLVLGKLGGAPRKVLDYWCLVSATGLSFYLAWYSARLVYVSHVTHDISGAADATPLWIPQLAMAAGAFGLSLAFAEDLLLKLSGEEVNVDPAAELARTE